MVEKGKIVQTDPNSWRGKGVTGREKRNSEKRLKISRLEKEKGKLAAESRRRDKSHSAVARRIGILTSGGRQKRRPRLIKKPNNWGRRPKGAERG